MTLHAVILTGSRDVENTLLAGTDLPTKVMLPVGGKPMACHVYDAMAASKYRPNIFISSGAPEITQLPFSGPYQLIESGKRAADSIIKALQGSGDCEWLLLISGDHVLITPEMIDYFVNEAISRQLSVAAAVVRKSLVDITYPTTRRSYFYFKGDAVSGGNMYLLHKPSFSRSVKVMDALDSNRKKPWKTIFMLDPISIVRLLLRQVDISGVNRFASNLFGCPFGMIEMPKAECCMDVDKLSDKEIAEQILAERIQPKAAAQLSDSTLQPQGAH